MTRCKMVKFKDKKKSTLMIYFHKDDDTLPSLFSLLEKEGWKYD